MFLAGVALLILVFAWTFDLFQGAKEQVSLESENPMASRLPMVLALMSFKVALLFIMGYIASLIGAKGLQLYGACRGVSPR